MATDILTADRRNQIAQMLVAQGSVKARELAKLFGVSTETIRKDILYLEAEGIAHKGYGGATLASSMVATPIDVKQTQNVDAKARIAAEAARRVPDGATVLLDAGSTTHALARVLAQRSGLTVFTNSLPALMDLTGSANTVFAFGGMTQDSSYGTVGSWANAQVHGLRVDVSFVGTDGFLYLAGPATALYEEAEFKRGAVEAGEQSYILADSTKFATRTRFEFARWDEVTGLITDADAPQEGVAEVQQHTKVVLA